MVAKKSENALKVCAGILTRSNNHTKLNSVAKNVVSRLRKYVLFKANFLHLEKKLNKRQKTRSTTSSKIDCVNLI